MQNSTLIVFTDFITTIEKLTENVSKVTIQFDIFDDCIASTTLMSQILYR